MGPAQSFPGIRDRSWTLIGGCESLRDPTLSWIAPRSKVVMERSAVQRWFVE
ncbi:MAG: hypothetical protein JNK57_00440 [Planctomycetaceae bacterium]|nr:hypothetical protein [Planctomycetaceae bacterium]